MKEYKVLTRLGIDSSGRFSFEVLESQFNSYASEGWEVLSVEPATEYGPAGFNLMVILERNK